MSSNNMPRDLIHEKRKSSHTEAILANRHRYKDYIWVVAKREVKVAGYWPNKLGQ